MTTTAVPKTVPLLAGIACEADSTATVPLVEERSFGFWQQEIPPEYRGLEAGEII